MFDDELFSPLPPHAVTNVALNDRSAVKAKAGIGLSLIHI